MPLEFDAELAEIESMKSILKALAPLDESTRGRVLRWTVDKFGIASPSARRNEQLLPQRDDARSAQSVIASPAVATSQEASNPEAVVYADLPALFSAASGSVATEQDRTLIVAYWHQVIKGDPDVESFRVNSDLKHLGFPVGNITRAFSLLMPALVMQTRKSGNSRQARKKFRLTMEGISRVKQLIAGTPQP